MVSPKTISQGTENLIYGCGYLVIEKTLRLVWFLSFLFVCLFLI